jgi:hypothetical protein
MYIFLFMYLRYVFLCVYSLYEFIICVFLFFINFFSKVKIKLNLSFLKYT